MSVFGWRSRRWWKVPPSVHGGEFHWGISKEDGKGYRSHDALCAWWSRSKILTRDLSADVTVSNGETAGVKVGVSVPWLVQAQVKLAAPRGWIAPWVLDARETGFTLGGFRWAEVRLLHEDDACGQRTYLLAKEKRGEGRSYAGRWALWEGVRLRWPAAKIGKVILGKREYRTEMVDGGTARVPMPEGVYLATWERKRAVWTRAHVPWTIREREHVDLTLPVGIPVPGKGENSWDCGDDGVYGVSARTLSEAVGNAVGSAMRQREQYGGLEWVPANGWPINDWGGA